MGKFNIFSYPFCLSINPKMTSESTRQIHCPKWINLNVTVTFCSLKHRFLKMLNNCHVISTLPSVEGIVILFFGIMNFNFMCECFE